MDCRGHTGVDAVAVAARTAGIWRASFEHPDLGGVTVAARHVTWALIHDHFGEAGWVAVRVDADAVAVPDTAGWLGPAQAPAGQLIANLTHQRDLPAIPGGSGAAAVSTAHPYELEWPATAYLHCPACRFIAPVACADHALTSEGRVDLDTPVVVGCGICGHRTDGREHARTRTTAQTCSRCAAVTAAPRCAARITCAGCHTWLIGAHIAGTTGQHEVCALEAVRRRALVDAARILRP